MKRYIQLQEELLDGQVTKQWRDAHDSDRGLMYRIESLAEFKSMKPGCRGIVVDKKLYMCNNPYLLHMDLIHFIQITEPATILNKINVDNGFSRNFNKFLTVQKGEQYPFLFCGESQIVSYNKIMNAYIKIVQGLKVPFIPIDIYYDRRPKKDIQEKLNNLGLSEFYPWK